MFRKTIAGVSAAIVAAGCSTGVIKTSEAGSGGPGGGCSQGATKCVVIDARFKRLDHSDPCNIIWYGVARAYAGALQKDGRGEAYWDMGPAAEYFFDPRDGIQIYPDGSGKAGFEHLGSKGNGRIFTVRVLADGTPGSSYKYSVHVWHRGASSAPDVLCGVIDPIIMNYE